MSHNPPVDPASLATPMKFAYWVPDVSDGLVVSVRELEASELERV